jgi:hypothetical protein
MRHESPSTTSLIFGVFSTLISVAAGSLPGVASEIGRPTAFEQAIHPAQACTNGLAQSSTPDLRPGAPPDSTPDLRDEPATTVLDSGEVQSVLGKQVRSSADENMGRVVDVLVDRDGHVRGAVIDFGGFLGVGSRKIAVDWNVLRFSPDADKSNRITLELTRDQVKAAPEFREGKPVVVLSALGVLLPFPSSKQPLPPNQSLSSDKPLSSGKSSPASKSHKSRKSER